MKLYSLSRRMCEWDDLDHWRERFRRVIANGDAGTLSPFLLLSLPGMTAAEQRDCAELWTQRQRADSVAERAALAFTFPRRRRSKIRLGYLSCDFHEHATALLMIELFEGHDRERFEIYAYSYGADDGRGMRQRLEATFDRFIDIQPLSNREAAQAIHGDEVDILVDLKGYTKGTRTGILMLRPAPIQVNYLGYPGTLGGDFCDYIITDSILTPPPSAADYSESFAYLPDSYQPHSRYSHIGAAPSRTAAGLPEQGFVFCCFNQAYKITPTMFTLWCRLLAACPGSVLWLLKDSMAEGNLRNLALSQGVAPHRLVFATDLPQAEHLGRLQLADLVLDTLPFNAHTTASDALWAGVPIITCAGQTFASRVAASLLHAIDLPELATPDLDAYYALALELASDADRLATVKQALADKRMTTALFDIDLYTRNLERLYRRMWQRHQDGDAPATLDTRAPASPGLPDPDPAQP